jgi:hypothetical protein
MPAAALAQTVTKAPPAFSGLGPYPTSGGGLYYGLNATGVASQIENSTAPGAAAIGGAVGGTIGYVDIFSPSTFGFCEAMFDFQNLNGGTAGLSLSGPAHLEQRCGFGSPLNQFLGSFISSSALPAVPGIPVLPPGVTAGPQNGYIYGAINEDDVSASVGAASAREWLIAPEFGVGMQSRLSNNVMADVWAGVKFSSNGLCIGSIACPKLGAGPVAGVSFKY